jgi:23S rRNA (cytidine1920-2'-O)/16S rRNA (cytidine1409-2'-O)-methyltransferase
MMCKPQFEAGKHQINKGIVKNSAIRRSVLKDFESWLIQNGFRILDKADSHVAGTKGNVERFYKLTCI